MEKYAIIFLCILFFISIYSQDNISDNYSQYNELSDSLINIINDFSDILDEDVIDSINSLYYSKEIISFNKIYSLVNNYFIADIIYKKLQKRVNKYLSSIGIYKRDIFQNEKKVFSRNYLKKDIHKVYFLFEKDEGENSYIDNYKLGYSYSNYLIIGNFRLKTGRGLFSDWSDYYYFSSIPFYSNRLETDLSYEEYSPNRGIVFTIPYKQIIPSIILSYNYYDAIINNDTVFSILKYNIHDDSLSISRKNNLSEKYVGILLRHINEIFNIAFSYSDYSHYINYIDNNKIYIIDYFGFIKSFSYDIAYSSNRAFAFNFSAKKFFDNINYYTGFYYNNSFFNTHSKYIANKDSTIFVFAKVHIKPLAIDYLFEYELTDTFSIINKIIFKPVRYFTITYKDKLNSDRDYWKFRLRSVNNKNISMFNTFIFSTDKSYIVRNDILIKYKNIKINNFIYYYNINNNPLYQYEYKIENIYPIKALYSGNGMRVGASIHFDINDFLQLNANILIEKSDSTKIQSGINLHISQ